MEISSSVTAVQQTINVLKHSHFSADYFNKTAELVFTTVFTLHTCIKKITKHQKFKKLNYF